MGGAHLDSKSQLSAHQFRPHHHQRSNKVERRAIIVEGKKNQGTKGQTSVPKARHSFQTHWPGVIWAGCPAGCLEEGKEQGSAGRRMWVNSSSAPTSYRALASYCNSSAPVSRVQNGNKNLREPQHILRRCTCSAWVWGAHAKVGRPPVAWGGGRGNSLSTGQTLHTNEPTAVLQFPRAS